MKWTRNEIDFLIKNSDKGSSWCCSELQRNKNSVLSKAKKLNIKFSKTKISENTRNKISESLKKAHIEKRHPGWSFINLSKDRRSYPEKFFIEVFNNNNLYNFYTIEEKFNYGKYFIDFLFVEIKLIVEIDGSQHYRNVSSIEHDIVRDNFFIKEGFRIYRIKWKNVIENSKLEINEFLNFVNNIEKNSIRKYSIDEYSKKSTHLEIFCKCGNVMNKNSKNCFKCNSIKARKVRRPEMQKLLLDIQEIGFLATGRKYGVSDNAIRKWIK